MVGMPCAARLAFARALVVARAQRRPTRQPLGRTKARHIVANLDHDQSRCDLVDARNGLQQTVRPGVRSHGGDQISVELRQLGLQRLNVSVNVAEREQMACAQVALQAECQFLALELERAACQAQQTAHVLPFDQPLDHGARSRRGCR